MNAPIVARLTATREDDSRIIVEVHADATFHRFYNFFSQQGSKRSTKKFLRFASRNEGLDPVNTHLQIPGLEILALRFVHNKFGSRVVSTRIRFYGKREYKRLINAAPDALGLTKVDAGFEKAPATLQIDLFPSSRMVSRRNHFKIHAGATQ